MTDRIITKKKNSINNKSNKHKAIKPKKTTLAIINNCNLNRKQQQYKNKQYKQD